MARLFPLPQAGDIVWCRFPHQDFSAPGPKPRPAIVVDIGRLRDEPAVEVVYGTSRKLERLYPGEFSITPEDGDAFVVSGLNYPTKFDTARSVFLPYNDEWFAVPPGAPHGQRPKLGVLHPSLMRRAHVAFEAVAGMGRT
jgi:mRNA-degrading endonuclease toxin of MazEF toxin-antitoxin module